MSQLKIKASLVLQKTIDAQHNKIICHQGSSRSSKTWSIFQYFILKALQGEQFVLTIARAKLTWVKSTLLKDFETLVNLYGLKITPEVNINRQEQVYMLNGSEFAFFGLDYAEKLHGRKQDYAWVNEVMEVDRKSFDQLEMRTTKQIIIDYNPADDEHWVFDLHKRSDVAVIQSTFRDNPFLEHTIVDKLLSYEPTPENIKRGTADNYMWEVYGLGNKARLQGAIFTNWEIKTLPENAKFLGFGLDFGFSADPTALVGCYSMDGELYFDEVIYETEMTNQDIADRFERLQISKSELIVADSSEPKSIEEIRRRGYAIIGAEKGQDSVKFGIDLLKQYKLNITPRSGNLENEFRKYKWAEDRQGKSLNVPVDKFNHGCDSIRYLTSHKLKAGVKVSVVNRAMFGI
jgi:phage terminase large subunit